MLSSEWERNLNYPLPSGAVPTSVDRSQLNSLLHMENGEAAPAQTSPEEAKPAVPNGQAHAQDDAPRSATPLERKQLELTPGAGILLTFQGERR